MLHKRDAGRGIKFQPNATKRENAASVASEKEKIFKTIISCRDSAEKIHSDMFRGSRSDKCTWRFAIRIRVVPSDTVCCACFVVHVSRFGAAHQVPACSKRRGCCCWKYPSNTLSSGFPLVCPYPVFPVATPLVTVFPFTMPSVAPTCPL